MTRLLSLLLTALLLLGPATAAHAEDDETVQEAMSVSTACVGEVQSRMIQQQRIFRDILFGRQDAKKDEPGSARYGEDGSAWIKIDTNVWRSASEGYNNTTWSDTQVNLQTEWEGMNEAVDGPSPRKPRLGLFASTGSLTSELVEPVTQAYRALRCRAAMVCETFRATLRGDEPEEDGRLEITVPGCTTLYAKPLEECEFDNDSNTEASEAQDDPGFIETLSDTVVRTHCQPLLEEITEREGEVIRLAVTYDAAYRSLLQFAGNFDLFIGTFQSDLLSPIRDAMSLVGYLTRIPCFISACNG